MAWRDMQDGNVELYYAILNILDWYTKDGKRFKTEMGVHLKVMKCLDALEELSDITPQDIAEANDCGECHGWTAVMSEFEKQWKNGERK